MLVPYLLFLSAATAPTAPPQIPAGAELKAAVAARDAELFAIVFERCDPVELRAMVTDDFEMYHDKDGFVARSGDAFVADYAKECAKRAAPNAWRSRRELVPGSLSVDPIPGYGAIEDGQHQFYERKGNGPEKLAGRASFTHVWALTPSGWRLARALSFSHHGAD
jgi:hypothetical protein